MMDSFNCSTRIGEWVNHQKPSLCKSDLPKHLLKRLEKEKTLQRENERNKKNRHVPKVSCHSNPVENCGLPTYDKKGYAKPCQGKHRMKKAMKRFDKRSHVQQQAGSLLEVDFRDLLKHEELIIDMCLFGGSIAVSHDMKSLIPVVGLLVNKYMRNNTMAQLLHVTEWLRSQLSNRINEQAAEVIDTNFEKPQGWWQQVRHSEMWTDIYKLISYATCICVHGMDTEKLKKANKYICDTSIMKACNMTKFVDTISSIIENVCTKVVQSWKAGSILKFFHSGESYQEWFNSSLRVEHEYYEKQNEDDFDRHGLLQEVMNLIRQGEEIIKVQEDKSLISSKSKKEDASKSISLIRKRLRSLIDLRQLLMNVMNSVKLRETPYSLLVCGGSSIGKSIFSEMLRRHFGRVRNLSDTPSYIRNSALPHWENWESFYWSVLLDDAACFKPDKVVGVDPSLAEIIQIVNPIATQPPRADLSDKGRAAIQAKLVMITSNVMDLNVSTYFSHPAAVMRRCGFQIILEVRDEFKNQAAQGLDSFKAIHSDDNYPDWWNITVRQPVILKSTDPAIRQGNIEDVAKETCVFREVSWDHDEGKTLTRVKLKTFLKWYNDSIECHFEKQGKVLESQRRIGNVPLCEHNLPKGMCCQELEEQVGVLHDGEVLLENFSVADSLQGMWIFGRHLYANIDFHTFFAALALFFLKDSFQETESNVCYRMRNSVYYHVSTFFMAIKTLLSVFLPFLFCSSAFTTFGLFALLYCVLHPCSTFVLCTGNVKTYDRVCLTLDYFRQAVVAWLAMKCDSYVDIVRGMGITSYHILGGSAFCLLILFSLVKTIQFFYSLLTRDKNEDADLKEEGQAHSFGKPFNVMGEPESLYAKQRTELDVYDIPRHTLSLKNKEMEEVGAFYADNLYCFTSKSKDDKSDYAMTGNCLFVKGHMALAQSHVVGDHNVARLKFIKDNHPGTTNNFVDFVEKSERLPLGEHLELFQIHSAPLRKDLTLSLPNKEIRAVRGSGFLLKRCHDGTLTYNRVKQLRFTDSIFGMKQCGWVYVPEQTTKEGDCGSLLFINTASGFVLVGMHQWANMRTGERAATDLTKIEQTIVETCHDVVEPGTCMTAKGKVGTLGVLHEKSIARTTNKNVPCEVLGCFDGFIHHNKSRVERTIFAEKMEQAGHIVGHGKPDMSYKASNRHFESLKGTSEYRYDCIQRIASKVLVEHIVKRIDPSFRDECHIVDQQTSINGQDGVRFVDAINLKTSAGFPWSESKKKHMFTESGDWNSERFVSDEVQSEIDRMWECYSEGKSANPVSKASLKDEARKFKKIEEHNTRVFFGGTLPFTIVQRQLFLWFVRLAQKNPYLFMMAPGIDAQSSQWDTLYKYLFDFSNDCIAGDYGGFDISMSASELHHGYEFIHELARALGAEQQHLKMMKACSEDVIHVLIDYFGTLVRVNCNPSGHALTVIINGIVNVLRTMTLFTIQEMENGGNKDIEEICETFFDKVHLMTYGDDNIMTVRNAPGFTHTYMQEKFAEMGIKYTMAEKDAESVPYIDSTKATFLKRGFRFEPELERVTSPLDESSMVKMVSLSIPTKVIPKEQQLAQCIMDCHREAFFHGKERFLYWHGLLSRIIIGTDVAWLVTMKTWEEYIDWYKSKDCISQQAGAVCERCGFSCHFINYRDDEDIRSCQFCSQCRFNEADLDCLHCGLEDACEQCSDLFELSVVCDFKIHSEQVRLYEGKCERCNYKKMFLRLLVKRPSGLGRGDGVSLNQITSL